jgi:FixJ family two-component response regulator
MTGRPKANLELTEAQRQELERMVRAGTSEKRMVFRARLVLECATGADNVQVAKRLGTSEQTVTLWRGRFLQEGIGRFGGLGP